jgi:serine/threonine-protein kinase
MRVKRPPEQHLHLVSDLSNQNENTIIDPIPLDPIPEPAPPLFATGSTTRRVADEEVTEVGLVTLSGTVLGHYRVLRQIAVGGMGVVYEGVHLHLRRRVAIKLLRQEMTSRPELLQRFLAEAVASANIGHPGVVTVLDYGYAEGGDAYLVMEYLQGENLARRIVRGVLSLTQSIEFGAQLASAMAAAHTRGVIHRDLKPENIYICENDGNGERIKILDFGLARFTSEGMLKSSQTHLGRLLGTPRYMSPEQANGQNQVDQKSDIYSLGCVLFHMITGQPPFRGSLMAVLEGHREHPPPPLHVWAPHAPPALATLLQRMMAKNPGERPAEMSEVERELRRVQAPPVVHALTAPVPIAHSRTVPTTLVHIPALTPPRFDPARRVGVFVFLSVLLVGITFGFLLVHC